MQIDHNRHTRRRAYLIPDASLLRAQGLPVPSIYFPVRLFREFVRIPSPFQGVGDTPWGVGRRKRPFFPVFSRLSGTYEPGGSTSTLMPRAARVTSRQVSSSIGKPFLRRS